VGQAVALLSLTLPAFAQVKVTPVGILGGRLTNSAIYSSNSRGQAVGWFVAEDGNYHYGYWQNSAVKPVDLGVITSFSADFTPLYINKLGHVLGLPVGGTPAASLWQPGQPIRNLGVPAGLPPLYAFYSRAINDSDHVVGSAITAGTYISTACYWANRTGWVILPHPAQYKSAWAAGINNNDQIVGSVTDFNYNSYPAIWDSPTSAPRIFGALWSYNGALMDSINDHGQAVGEYSDPYSGNVYLLVWSSAGGMSILVGPPNYDTGTAGIFWLHISNDGTVVGTLSDLNYGIQEPFVWTSAGGYQELYPTFQTIYSINNEDQIAGQDTAQRFFYEPDTGQGIVYANLKVVTYSSGVTTHGSGTPSQPGHGLNNAGAVVGDSYAAPYGDVHPFLWTASGGTVDLTPTAGKGAWNNAVDVNDLGVVLGLEQPSPYSANPGEFHVLWTPNGGEMALPVPNLNLFGPYENGAPTAINNANQAVGYYRTSFDTFSAYLYDPVTGTVSSPLMGLDNGNSFAYGLNNSGQITGVFQADAQGHNHAYLFDPNAATPLTDLGDPGSVGSSIGYAINDSGEVVGASLFPDYSLHIILWPPNGAPINPGSLGGGSGAPYHVNNFGQVVGYSYTSTYAEHAILISDAAVMTDLNTLAPAGWTFTYASAINLNGQISGTGLYNGVTAAFLITPKAVLSALKTSSRIVKAGQTTIGTVTLSTTAPYDLYVTLTTSTPALTVPAWVKIPAGASTAQFTIVASATAQSVDGNITGTFAHVSRSAGLTVVP
jgi:probable HAF family extracellular repeat protein